MGLADCSRPYFWPADYRPSHDSDDARLHGCFRDFRFAAANRASTRVNHINDRNRSRVVASIPGNWTPSLAQIVKGDGGSKLVRSVIDFFDRVDRLPNDF